MTMNAGISAQSTEIERLLKITNIMEIIGIADVKEVLILLIKTSLNVLLRTSLFSEAILNVLWESFNLSNNITVS